MSSDPLQSRHPDYRYQQVTFGAGILAGLGGLGYQLYNAFQDPSDPPDWLKLSSLVGVTVMASFGMYWAHEYKHPIATIPDDYVVFIDGEPSPEITAKVHRIYEDCGLHAQDHLHNLGCLGELEEIHTRCKERFGSRPPGDPTDES